MYYFLAYLILLFCISPVPIRGQSESESYAKLEVKLIGTSVEERADTYVIGAKVRLIFSNDTNNKLLLLPTYQGHWGKTVYKRESDRSFSVLESRLGGNSYRDRSKQRSEVLSLDVLPASVKKISRGETFELEDTVNIVIYKYKSGVHGYRSEMKDIVIDELKDTASLWLKIGYRFWDPNLDLDLKTMKKLKFSDKLRRKWLKFGFLWTEPVESEPIEIPLPQFAHEAH